MLSIRATARIAILIPCYNGEVTIAQVVADFGAVLPEASIYVYYNNSTDRTRAVAQNAGAIVQIETLQGKGHVVRQMFADVDAVFYVLVDGDNTHDARAIIDMVGLLAKDNLDMVTGARKSESEAYRAGHQFGNVVLTGAVRLIFGARVSDMLSGIPCFQPTRREVVSGTCHGI
ncbi:glycosyltransferase family 2 protein [Rhodopila sp.]|uniref:glycosyltransferase family 2 protein n=1 Tax=Rhodopila sp. TaxID=2480087 RepID=UPI003D0BC8FC